MGPSRPAGDMEFVASTPPNVPEPMIYLACSSSHPAMAFYELLRPHLLGRLDEEFCSYVMTLLSSFRHREPVIRVLVGDHIRPSQDNTETVQRLRALENDLRVIAVKQGIERVEISKGSVSFSNASICGPRQTEYEEEVPCGASIGLKVQRVGTGTFGCYVEDIDSGKCFGLTCAHLFASFPGPSTSNRNIVMSVPGTEVVQPSNEDFDNLLKQTEADVTLGEAQMQESNLDRARIAKLQRDVVHERDRLTHLKNLQGNTVFAKTTSIYELGVCYDAPYTLSSGQAYLFDYMLLEVEERRKGRNIIRKPFEKLYESIGVLEEDENIWKTGRTTGTTQSTINGVYADIKTLPGFVGIPFAMSVVATGVFDAAFTQSGDSGAVCWNRHLQATGLATARTTRDEGRTELAIIGDLSKILSRIQERWGLRLRIMK